MPLGYCLVFQRPRCHICIALETLPAYSFRQAAAGWPCHSQYRSDAMQANKATQRHTITFFQTKKAAMAQVGSLSDTSKMPGLSWGISAQLCETGRKLALVPGSICSKCYACRGFYAAMPSVAKAHSARIEAWHADRPGWRAAMVRLLEGQAFFRWFDSGDLQGEPMLDDICDIAEATPNTAHWMSTRESAIVKAVMSRRSIPDNLVIRLSAPMPDQAIKPIVTGNVALVHSAARPAPGAHICPAPQQGGACGDCRACWSKSVAIVSYAMH